MEGGEEKKTNINLASPQLILGTILHAQNLFTLLRLDFLLV